MTMNRPKIAPAMTERHATSDLPETATAVSAGPGSAAGDTFQRGGKAYQLCVPLDAQTWICRDLQDGSLVEFAAHEVNLPPAPIVPGATGPLHDAPNSVRRETARRRRYLREVAREGTVAFRRGGALRAIIDRVAKQFADGKPPSDSTVVRWWQALVRDGFAGLVSHTDLRGGKGKSRLSAGHREKIARAVDQCLERPRRGVTDILAEANQQVATENAWSLGDPARPISRATLYRFRLKRPAIELLTAKVGAAEAHRLLSLSKAKRHDAPRRPLQWVQSDHGLLDVLLVDEATGKVVGRAYLSVMLCAVTRLVVAWEVSLACPNEQTVLALLRQAMTGLLGDKRARRSLDGSAGPPDQQPPLAAGPSRRLAHGQVEMLLFDRAKEFDSAAVQAACADLDVVAMFCPAYSPDSKGHVERFIGTVNRSLISTLPGTTFGSPKERRGYDAEDHATLTITDLRTIVGTWIDTVYALTPHDGLNGATPENVWRQLAAAHPPGSLHSDDAVAWACRPRMQRCIGKSGIKLFGNQRYASAELENIRRQFGVHCEVTVRFDPWDIGHIWVTHPASRQEFTVPNVDPAYAGGLTLREHELLRKRERACHRQATDGARLTANRNAVRREVERAQADKRLRQRKAAAIAKDAARHATPATAAPASPADLENPIPTLGSVRIRERKELPGFALGRTPRLHSATPQAGGAEETNHEE